MTIAVTTVTSANVFDRHIDEVVVWDQELTQQPVHNVSYWGVAVPLPEAAWTMTSLVIVATSQGKTQGIRRFSGRYSGTKER